MLSTDTETLKKIKVQKTIFTRFSLGWKLKTSGPDFSKLSFKWLQITPGSFSKHRLYICVDFIQGACTESLDSQVQGATTHPPHP